MKSTALIVGLTRSDPADRDEWNTLAESNGNLVQSTLFDPVQGFFRMQPVYLEVRLNGTLVGGVKLYRWEARRARRLSAFLSRSVTQFGELLSGGLNVPLQDIVAVLQRALSLYLQQEGAISFRNSGVYGEGSRLLAPSVAPRSQREYRVAWVDLHRSLDEIWGGVHDKHRREIRKAEGLGVTVFQDDDVDGFLELLAESYRDQARAGPNPAYVRHAYQILRASDRAHLFFAKHGGERLAGAMVHRYGEIASYDFAGLRRNRVGAGHLLQWTIMQRLRTLGTRRYILGQVSEPGTIDGSRFEGISRFKRRFGSQELESSASFYALKPVRHALWSFVTRWTI
jgi:hypothetical protein